MRKSGIVAGVCGVATVTALVVKKVKDRKRKDELVLREIDKILKSCENISLLKDVDASTGEIYCLDTEENCELASYIHTINQLALMLKYLESDMVYTSGYGISSGLKRALTAYDKLVRTNPDAKGASYGKDLSKARLSKETKEYIKDCEGIINNLNEKELDIKVKNVADDLSELGFGERESIEYDIKEKINDRQRASDSEQFDGFQ